jgi:tetratricopeptide (TPR) repeat protein
MKNTTRFRYLLLNLTVFATFLAAFVPNALTQTESHNPPSSKPTFLAQTGADEFFSRGFTLFSQNRYQESLASFERGLQIKPDFGPAWLARGLVLGQLERYQEALTSIDKGLQIQPDLTNYAEPWLARGAALLGLKRYREAITSIDRALQIKPNYPEAVNARDLALKELNSTTTTQTPARSQPRTQASAEALLTQALAAIEQKRYEEAASAFDKVLKVQPDNPVAWLGKGIVTFYLGRYQEVAVAMSRVIELKPAIPSDQWAMVWGFRGIALVQIKQNQEALSSLDKALQYKISDKSVSALVLIYRVRALSGLGRYQDALAYLDGQLRVNPNLIGGQYYRGYILDALKRYEEALKEYDEAGLDNSPTLHNKGITLANLKRHQEAIASYDKAIQYNKYIVSDESLSINFFNLSAADSWYARGLSLFALKRYQEAVNSFDKAISLQPKFSDAIKARQVAQKWL